MALRACEKFENGWRKDVPPNLAHNMLWLEPLKAFVQRQIIDVVVIAFR